MLNPVRKKPSRNCTHNSELKGSNTLDRYKPLHEEVLREEILVSDCDSNGASPYLKHNNKNNIKSPKQKKKKNLASQLKRKQQSEVKVVPLKVTVNMGNVNTSLDSGDYSTDNMPDSGASAPKRKLVFQKWQSPVFATSHDLLKQKDSERKRR